MSGTVALSSGLWGVLATPFLAGTLEIDEDSLRREVELFTSIHTAGLVALGVFGEASRLTPDERYRVVDTVCRSKGSLPLVVGISTRETDEAIRDAVPLVNLVRSHGGSVSLMLQVNSDDPASLAQHIGRVHDATDAGIVVQDYPVASGVHIASHDIVAAIQGCDFIAAIKSEAPPTSLAVAELTAETDVPVFGGLGGLGLLDELAAGSAGAMTGFSRPEGLAETLEAWADGGYGAAVQAYRRWLPLVNFEAQAQIGLGIRKASLHRRGVLSTQAVRPPGREIPAALEPILDRHLRELDDPEQ